MTKNINLLSILAIATILIASPLATQTAFAGNHANAPPNQGELLSLIDTLEIALNNAIDSLTKLISENTALIYIEASVRAIADESLQSQIDTIELTPGPQGETGLPGPAGVNGMNGIDGTNGIDGVQGPAGTDVDPIVLQDLIDRITVLESTVASIPPVVTVDCTARGPSVNLQGCDLSYTNLRGAILITANLQGVNFTGAFLNDADLAGADVNGADFTRATLTGTNFAGAINQPTGAIPCIGTPSQYGVEFTCTG